MSGKDEFPEFVVGHEPSFGDLVQAMGEDDAAGYEGTLHINLPGTLPFAPKYLFLNGIEYLRVDKEESDGIHGSGHAREEDVA